MNPSPPFCQPDAVRRILIGLAALFYLPASAQVPEGGTEMIAETSPGDAGYYSGSGPVTSRTIVGVTGQSFSEATEVATLNPTGQFYSSAVTFNSDRSVANGDVVLLRFFARMIETTDESGTATMEVYVEGPAPDYTKSVQYRVNVAGAWQEFYVPFTVDGSYAVGDLDFKFGFGATGRPQVIQVGGVEAWWYGTTKTLAEMPRTSFEYAGRAPDAAWRAEAAARIEQFRKGDYRVTVVDENGDPLPGERVRVRLQRHDFEFGTAMVASRLMANSSASARTYRSKILELFNAGTLENDTKWPPWIGEWGSSFNQPQTVAALNWAQQQGLAMRGHVLVWPSERNMPEQFRSALAATDPGIPQVILDHIEDVLTTTAGKFVDWDVMNEPFDNFDVMQKYGDARMIDWFNEAREHAPTEGLFVNDYGILSGGGLNTEKQDAYIDTVNFIKNGGGPVTGIGFQGHFSGTPTSITKVWEVLQKFSTAFPDLDFRVTEFDITGEDPQLQADYLRDFYTIAFSHPQMIGIQLWGFWEEAHWRPDSALYTSDWTERDIGRAYRELVHETWQTNEVGVADADGNVAGRGFAGDYVVEDLSGRALGTFSLPAAGQQSVTVLMGESSGGRLSNLSTRGAVGTGANIMVAGFVIEGSMAKDLVIRAVGPQLAEYGVTGELADPQIALYQNINGDPIPMMEVDGWDPSLSPVFASLGAFALDNDTASAATRVQLQPGPYTVHVSGVNAATGVALVEVYDAASGAPVQMVNLSTRGFVGTGGDAMFAGFVITGDSPQRVLIRGVGPTLSGFGVTGALADPLLQLRRGSELVASNQDWSTSSNSAQIVAVTSGVGGFALDPDAGDAALLVDLTPDSYTVELSGADGGTGVGLVEVYRVP
jgi:endo-1,4-beta-xylanase